MTIDPDFSVMTDEDLIQVVQDINAELNRRRLLAQIPEQVAALNREFLKAEGVEDGAPWKQPTGVVGAYMTGDVVLHRDAEWRSLIDYNVQEPGNPDDPQAYRWWENLTDAPVEGAWAPGVEYATGQTVTYNGVEYTCVQEHTSQPGWTPDAVPSLWQPVEST